MKAALLILQFLFLADDVFAIVRPLQNIKKDHKDDLIILDNGDRITGEIRKMEHGILYLKSDRAVDTLQLDWRSVRGVKSRVRYEFEMAAGRRYIGLISGREMAASEIVILLEDGSMRQTRLSDILAIHEMRRSFLGRLNLTLDGGITFTQGNKQTQTNVQESLEYSQPRYSFRQNLSSLFTHQSDSKNTSRHEFQLVARRYLAPSWDYLGLGVLLNDNQQNLDLRTTLGGGFQRTFSRSHRMLFSGLAGFVYTKENYADELDSDRNNAEILTGLVFDRYRFRSSEIRIYALVFPSVSNPGRVRSDISGYWKWEIVKDLYWKFSGFDNFDSDPPPNSPKNNFGITSSVGWSF